jgi:hypothetical protein
LPPTHTLCASLFVSALRTPPQHLPRRVQAIFRKAADTVYFNAMRASMSDVVRGKELTISASKIATYAGVGVMCGPIFTQRIMIPLLGGAVEMSRYAFAINVGTLSVAALWIASRLREPLAKDQRKPMNWITCNPFNFLAMLTSAHDTSFFRSLAPNQGKGLKFGKVNGLKHVDGADHAQSRARCSSSW